MARVFGRIAGVDVGQLFDDREDVRAHGVHLPRQAGISGSQSEGADSIVVNGGYEDDEDYGSLIIYTGHGGNDPASKKQVADQKFERGNKALAVSAIDGLPVRVVRGPNGDPQYSPVAGYRYDGLYSVEDYWSERGKSGHLVWRFRLVRLEDPLQLGTRERPSTEEAEDDSADKPQRRSTSVQRIVRSTEVAQRVKRIHNHRCQICGTTIDTPGGRYAEGAHVKPLGRPHDGPDVADNILCLCPNDHVRLDRGSIWIDSDLQVWDREQGIRLGHLRTDERHSIAVEHLRYRRKLTEGN